MRALIQPFRAAATSWLRLRYYVQAQPLSLPSESEKREYIKLWQRMTGHRIFVETGTYLGKTTLAMSEIFDRCYTIEIDPKLHQDALLRFKDRPNITPLLGDSKDKIAEVLAELDSPAIFWLDGHYSGGITGGAPMQAPIELELLAILQHRVKDHVIMIDDARLFLGRRGYPSLQRLNQLVSANSSYSMRLSTDIIRIYRDDL